MQQRQENTGANQRKRPIQILVYWRADPTWELARLIYQGFVVTGATTLMKKLLTIELAISSVTNYRTDEFVARAVKLQKLGLLDGIGVIRAGLDLDARQ